MPYLIAAAAVLIGFLHLAVILRRRTGSGRAKARPNEEDLLSKAIVEGTPRGIHMYTLDGKDRLVLTGYNAAAERILGIDHSGLVGKTIEEAFPSLATSEIPTRYREAAIEGLTWSSEQVEYADGSVKGAFEVMAFKTKPRSMAAVFSEITERKQAEELLRNLNQELGRERAYTQTLLESLPGIFYLYEYPELRLVAWNRNHETDLGFTAEEIRGRDLREWHVPEAKAAVIEAVDRCMREGEASIEAPLVAKDGRRIPYLLTGKPFMSGGRSYLMGVGIDLSERVAAEERLRVLNQELEARVEERTSLLSESNAALATALGQLRESQAKMLLSEKMAALGQLIASLAHELNTPLGAILSASETSAAGVASLPGLFALQRSLDSEESKAFDAVARNFTAGPEADRTEERRKRRRYMDLLDGLGLDGASLLAEQLIGLSFEGSDDELAAMARLPRFPEIVGAAYQAKSIERSDYVIKAAAQKVARVVAALGTYARSEPDGRPVRDNVIGQVETVLLILENRTKPGVEVVRDYGEIPPVPCHPDRLAQVWMNLLTNALQAMEYRGRLVVSTRLAGDRVEVSVTDDGEGIPDAVRDRIFEPFFTTKIAGEGLGLGLDICRRILEEIGAAISFESRPGRTCFTVSLRTGMDGGA
jgi:PAS domain S-box-containing protein